MRGGKGRQWEGGIRQPLYLCVPGKRNGETTKCLASGIDLHPTLIELAGGTSNPELDGISLVPELVGKEMPSRKLYWHYPHYGNQGGEPSAILRDGEWKLIYYYEDHRAELYHLGRDLGETSDLSGAEPERTAELLNDLKAWLVEVDALMPSVNPNFNLEAEQAALQRLTNVGIPKREREHFRYLSEQFVPNGGWWQKKKN